MEKSLLILGAGEFGEVTKEIAEDIGGYAEIEFLDDMAVGALGRLSEYEQFRDRFTDAVVAIDEPSLRLNFIEKLKKAGYNVPVLVHPMAYVSKSAKLGAGTIVQPFALVHTATRVGKGCIISAGVIANHHSVIADGVHLGANSTLVCNTAVGGMIRTVSGQLYTPEINLRKTLSWGSNYSFDDGV